MSVLITCAISSERIGICFKMIALQNRHCIQCHSHDSIESFPASCRVVAMDSENEPSSDNGFDERGEY